MHFEEALTQQRAILASGAYDAPVEAEAFWRTYLPKAPSPRDLRMAHAALAEVLCMQQRFGESVEEFELGLDTVANPADRLAVLVGMASAVRSNQRESDVRHVASMLHETLTKWPEATRAGGPWGYTHLAHLTIFLGEPEVAKQHAQTAVAMAESLGTGKAEAYRSLAAVFEAEGKTDEALTALETAMGFMAPAYCLMEARAWHSRLLLKLGDQQSAVASLMEAVAIPDMRDRNIVATVLAVIGEIGEVDAVAAVRCVRALAAHLNSSCAISAGVGG